MEDNLKRLGEFGEYEVADGEPDPRGWRVLSSEGERIGDIDDLIVDTSALKVRYLDCDLDESGLNLSGSDRDRHVLIPVGFASLNRADREVRVGVNRDDVLNLPEYRGGPLTAALASQVQAGFSGREPLRETRDVGRETRESLALRSRERRPEELREGEQRMTRSEEELAVGKRMVDAGEVDIHKHVETEHVHQPVTRRREEVDVERRPVSGVEAGRITDEEEIRVPLREEEIIVEKRPVVKEEVVVRRRGVDEQVDVDAEVRKERIDVERHGQPREGIVEETERFRAEPGGIIEEDIEENLDEDTGGFGERARRTIDESTEGLGDQAGKAMDKATDRLRDLGGDR